MSIPDYLFVYGTLMTGMSPFALDRIFSQICRLQGQGFIRAKLYGLGAYPGAIPSSQKEDRVYGEVFEILLPDACFPDLDEHEDYRPGDLSGSEYIRTRGKVYLGDKLLEVWVYYYNGAVQEADRILSGDWRRHVLQSDEQGIEKKA